MKSYRIIKELGGFHIDEVASILDPRFGSTTESINQSQIDALLEANYIEETKEAVKTEPKPPVELKPADKPK